MDTKIVGDTPLKENDFLSKKFCCSVFVKEEFRNPNKSSKDRPACYLVKDAIDNHKIQPGGTFVEASSGNTGIAIAWMAKLYGYKSTIFVSKSCSVEKLDVLRSHDAEIVICENSNGIQDPTSTQSCARAYAENNPDSFFTNQYENQVNALAHYETTGPEIWEQSHGKVTHVFIGVGTGGTISGVGRYLKEQNNAIQIIGIEPCGSILSDYLENGIESTNDVPMDKIEGIGRKFVPSVFDPRSVDRIDQVSIEDAINCARQHHKDTKQLLGFSSAAVVSSFADYMEKKPPLPEDFYVLLFPDYGDRYLKVLYPDLEIINADVHA